MNDVESFSSGDELSSSTTSVPKYTFTDVAIDTKVMQHLRESFISTNIFFFHRSRLRRNSEVNEIDNQ